MDFSNSENISALALKWLFVSKSANWQKRKMKFSIR